MKTYWLYRDNEVLTAVRAPDGSDDDHVRSLAVASHQRVPLRHPDYAPYEFTRMLLSAEVKRA